MQRERVADDIYVFTSDLYAQVTAGVIMTSEGAVVIDTLAYPEETLPPKVREALRLIKENPQEYARRFSNQISYIRVMGGVAWSMFFIALFATLHSLYLLYF